MLLPSIQCPLSTFTPYSPMTLRSQIPITPWAVNGNFHSSSPLVRNELPIDRHSSSILDELTKSPAGVFAKRPQARRTNPEERCSLRHTPQRRRMQHDPAERGTSGLFAKPSILGRSFYWAPDTIRHEESELPIPKKRNRFRISAHDIVEACDHAFITPLVSFP